MKQIFICDFKDFVYLFIYSFIYLLINIEILINFFTFLFYILKFKNLNDYQFVNI